MHSVLCLIPPPPRTPQRGDWSESREKLLTAFSISISGMFSPLRMTTSLLHLPSGCSLVVHTR